MTYSLRLSDDEVARYRLMAEQARAEEGDLWQRAGLIRGARVADIGCGPGIMTALLAEIVGPDGYLIGIDGDAEAVEAATALFAATGAGNAEARHGGADDSGLTEGAFDVVVMRHVLAHNGGAEQRIVDHLARLVRPGGHVYLLDIDLSRRTLSPSLPDVDQCQQRYEQWHADRGNDLQVGRRLADLASTAGLIIEVSRNWPFSQQMPPGMRGPAWAARDAIRDAGLATPGDLARWALAFDEIDTWTERPTFSQTLHAAVCTRPARTPGGPS